MTHLSGRATGRTTRMLGEALRATLQYGQAVYVIAANSKEVDRIKLTLAKLCPEWESLGVKVETVNDSGDFDWDELRVRGVSRETRVLVDHYAIEQRYANVLEELHRYDYGPNEHFAREYYGRFEPEPQERKAKATGKGLAPHPVRDCTCSEEGYYNHHRHADDCLYRVQVEAQ